MLYHDKASGIFGPHNAIINTLLLACFECKAVQQRLDDRVGIARPDGFDLDGRRTAAHGQQGLFENRQCSSDGIGRMLRDEAGKLGAQFFYEGGNTDAFIKFDHPCIEAAMPL